ncbi:MAG TPA: 3-methyl-2-oxobutanoate hydroxymethyltransferase [Alphaproteobacteria bacterium]|nr:3-methyl-2-oxobutanoate hydroxymethyltransferase [Alphaproteobacteria bacterium]
MRNSIKTILDLKKVRRNIVCLTAYTYPVAQILDEHADILLVGDSLGMVIYGFDSTLPVTLEMMINHAKAVVKGSNKALVVVDMPFGSYQEDKGKAFPAAVRIMKETGAQAVKLEGGEEMAKTIEFLVKRGVPVMAHIGLRPQYFNTSGGYMVEGKTDASKKQLLADLEAVQRAGAFAVVVEGVTKKAADEICKKAKIPVIGIGASDKCDGQVLVIDDLIGLTEKNPKFAPKYAEVRKVVSQAVKKFSTDVRTKKFPKENNLYS